ncbi:MAG: precorrin-2 dehydrogenase/sirohydrochlorin ferrochelatase family protein, partial [Asticcacaulis sp.]
MLALPLSWPLKGRTVVLIGEGVWLDRKLALLERTPAELKVFTGGEWPQTADLEGAALIIVAYQDRERAEKAAAFARTARAPLNVVDYPDLSDFHVPAIVDRGPMSIGIATGGTAPVLARETRAKVEAAVPPSDTQLAEFALALSGRLREAIPDVDARRRVWEDVLKSPAADLARSGRIDDAVELALKQI